MKILGKILVPDYLDEEEYNSTSIKLDSKEMVVNNNWSPTWDKPTTISLSKFAKKIYKIIKKHPNIILSKLAKKIRRNIEDTELNACLRVLEKYGYIISFNNSFVVTNKRFLGIVSYYVPKEFITKGYKVMS